MTLLESSNILELPFFGTRLEETQKLFKLNITRQETQTLTSALEQQSHLLRQNRRSLSQHEQTQAIATRYSCDLCHRSYMHFHHLVAHQRYECGKEPRFQCEICKKKFRQKQVLYRHIRCMHQIYNRHQIYQYALDNW